ncbi:CGNR zinc finger domain-containing protein [Naasia sp. SYSU D00057]|uniref:CGNR zinc finger domain-containing protein n=1 Tax=Naasia sp. SYSU D00057 TaxID=2817380 RepID=UPI001FEE897B|nr:CGNR zinc finger domain-containing protein [Naasia sp. SYSU D00057]
MIGVRLAEELVNLEVEGRWTRDRVAGALTASLVRLDGLEQELGELRDWTGRLREVFAAAESDERCARINELLDVGVHRVHLSAHDGLPPHLHFVRDDQRLTERVQAMTIGGLAIFAVEAQAGRMGICARPGCGRAFADTSRNGRRAYCSPLCGNSHAVQRYRARTSTTVAGETGAAEVFPRGPLEAAPLHA